jgi:hypothetical protein
VLNHERRKGQKAHQALRSAAQIAYWNKKAVYGLLFKASGQDMLDHPTLDQLKSLRLDGMAEAFAEMQTQDGTAGLSQPRFRSATRSSSL